jgi:hypothetical protein
MRRAKAKHSAEFSVRAIEFEAIDLKTVQLIAVHALLWAALTALGAFRLTPTLEIHVLPWTQILAQGVLLGLAQGAFGVVAQRLGVSLRLMAFTAGLIFSVALMAQLVHPWVPYLAPAPLAAALVALFVGRAMGVATNLLVAFVVELLGPPLAGLIAFAGVWWRSSVWLGSASSRI